MASQFGSFIRELRTNKGISLSSLAKRSGVSQPYLSQLENGRKGIPSPEILKKLSEALDVPYQELMVEAAHIKYEDWMDSFLEEGWDSEEDKIYEKIFKQKREKALSNDLEDILKQTLVFYKGQKLTKEDRERVLDMLSILFSGHNK